MLAWLGAALAMPLSVGDEASLAEVSEALHSLWPDAPVELSGDELVGDGLTLDQGTLTWYRAGSVVRQQDQVDPVTAVVLARSWLAGDDGLGGEVPEISFFEAEPPAKPEPLPVPKVPRQFPPLLWVGAGLDRGLTAASWSGVSTAAGWLGEPFELDLALTVTFPGASGLTETDRLGQTRRVRVASASLSALWDFSLERRVASAIVASPLIELGAEAGPTRVRIIVGESEPRVRLSRTRLGGSVCAGLGASVWAGTAVGLRGTLRARIDPSDPTFWASISLLVGTRPKDPGSP